MRWCAFEGLARVMDPRESTSGKTTSLTSAEAGNPPLAELSDLPLVADAGLVAQLLGISKTAVYEAVRRGELPALHIGRRVLFPKEVLVEFLRRPLARARGARSTRGTER